jgi:hypothetical protein
MTSSSTMANALSSSSFPTSKSWFRELLIVKVDRLSKSLWISELENSEPLLLGKLQD